jgi:hypothetical protein
VPLIAWALLSALAAQGGAQGEPQGLSLGTREAPAPSQQWRVEGVLAINATSPSSNVETTVAPWFGVRAGSLAPTGTTRDGAAMGFDGALFVGTVSEGTPEVKTSRTIAFAEGRGLFAPMRVASTFSALVPYGFAGASLGGGVVEVRAFEDARVRPLFTWAARVGLGAELQVHALTTRVELGAGLRDLRAELSSAMTLGVAF